MAGHKTKGRVAAPAYDSAGTRDPLASLLVTDRSRWPGCNEMGSVLEKIQADLQ